MADTPARPKSPPRLSHEKFLHLLQTNIQALLNSYDEPIALMVGVAWHPKLSGDLPFGMLIAKEDITPDLLNQCLKQNIKMSEYIVAGLRQKVEGDSARDTPIRSPSKESNHGQEATPPVDFGPFAPGTK
jgi:hypothetical protein